MNSIILYDNVLSQGTLAADSTDGTDTAYDVANLIDFRSYTLWKSGGTADQYITVELGAQKSADTIGIYNHNLGTIGATIQVEYWDGAAWQDCGLTINPADDTIILATFTSAYALKFRIKLTTLGATPIIGIIMLGVRITFEYPPDSPAEPFNEGIVSTAETSKAGHLLGTDNRYYPVEPVFSWSNFTRSWVDTYFRAFWTAHARLSKPFFFAWDLTNRPNEVYWFKVKPNSRYTQPMSILSIVDRITLDVMGVSE